MSDINIGAITEALNDKSDRDLRNVDNTAGADAVVDYQMPTAENNYTWYRKYKSGWAEMGGNIDDGTTHTDKTIIFPVTMADTTYNVDGRCVNDSSIETGSDVQPRFANRTTTTVTYRLMIINGNNATNRYVFTWRVSGLAA